MIHFTLFLRTRTRTVHFKRNTEHLGNATAFLFRAPITLLFLVTDKPHEAVHSLSAPLPLRMESFFLGGLEVFLQRSYQNFEA